MFSAWRRQKRAPKPSTSLLGGWPRPNPEATDTPSSGTRAHTGFSLRSAGSPLQGIASPLWGRRETPVRTSPVAAKATGIWEAAGTHGSPIGWPPRGAPPHSQSPCGLPKPLLPGRAEHHLEPRTRHRGCSSLKELFLCPQTDSQVTYNDNSGDDIPPPGHPAGHEHNFSPKTLELSKDTMASQ